MDSSGITEKIAQFVVDTGFNLAGIPHLLR